MLYPISFPPSLSVVLGWVVHLGCKLVELDVMLNMDQCVRPSVHVYCDHSCASLARKKVVRVVDGSDAQVSNCLRTYKVNEK